MKNIYQLHFSFNQLVCCRHDEWFMGAMYTMWFYVKIHLVFWTYRSKLFTLLSVNILYGMLLSGWKNFHFYQLQGTKISLVILLLNKINQYRLKDGRRFENSEGGLVQLEDIEIFINDVYTENKMLMQINKNFLKT